MVNGVGNAGLCRIYKGPVVPLQSVHTIAIAIKLMSLFLRTAQPSCTRNNKSVEMWLSHRTVLGRLKVVRSSES